MCYYCEFLICLSKRDSRYSLPSKGEDSPSVCQSNQGIFREMNAINVLNVPLCHCLLLRRSTWLLEAHDVQKKRKKEKRISKCTKCNERRYNFGKIATPQPMNITLFHVRSISGNKMKKHSIDFVHPLAIANLPSRPPATPFSCHHFLCCSLLGLVFRFLLSLLPRRYITVRPLLVPNF